MVRTAKIRKKVFTPTINPSTVPCTRHAASAASPLPPAPSQKAVILKSDISTDDDDDDDDDNVLEDNGGLRLLAVKLVLRRNYSSYVFRSQTSEKSMHTLAMM
jgi:hypothetical protein